VKSGTLSRAWRPIVLRIRDFVSGISEVASSRRSCPSLVSAVAVHIRKMNNLVEQIAREIVYNGAACIRISAGIRLFTELVIFGDVLYVPSVDMPCVDEDAIEMKFELLEMEFPYQESDKYKWLHYYIQDMVRCVMSISHDKVISPKTRHPFNFRLSWSLDGASHSDKTIPV